MNDTEKDAQDIHARATKSAESNVYTLTNPYTTHDEKIEIESWYQLPIDTGGWAYLIFCILWAQGMFNWWQAYLLAAGVGIMTTLFAWFLYSKKTVIVLKILLGFPITKWLVSIGFAVWLWMNDSSMQAMFIIGNLVLFYMPFGFPAIIANQILTSKYNMHPKYALLKHVYGKEYHFE